MLVDPLHTSSEVFDLVNTDIISKTTASKGGGKEKSMRNTKLSQFDSTRTDLKVE